MNYNILFIIVIAVVVIAGVIAMPAIKNLRHVFRVPEGWTGLVYHHGLYVRRDNAGRHVLWGIGWTMSLIDLRRTSLLAAGQEVLTADSVGLKLSLLVTYQVTEPIKAAHETQNWLSDLQRHPACAASGRKWCRRGSVAQPATGNRRAAFGACAAGGG